MLAKAQSSLTKMNLVGLGLNCSYLQTYPALVKSINVFYKRPRHQVSFGLDVVVVNSPKTFAGFQTGYAYALNKPNKHMNAYLAYTFQYVRYGQGTTGYAPYNYLPTTNTSYYCVWRTISITNTIGLRISYTIAQLLSLYAEMGAGYEYSQIEPSPLNLAGELVPFPQGWCYTPVLRAGLNFKIASWWTLVKHLLLFDVPKSVKVSESRAQFNRKRTIVSTRDRNLSSAVIANWQRSQLPPLSHFPPPYFAVVQ